MAYGGGLPPNVGRRIRNALKYLGGTKKTRPRQGRRGRMNAGKIALREVNKLKAQIEIKTIFFQQNQVIPAAGTAQLNSILIVSAGDAQNQRDGDKVVVTSVSMRYRIETDLTETEDALYRVLLVYDRRPNGALAAIDAVLQNSDWNGLYESGDSRYRGRFQILMDRSITLGGSNGMGLSEVHGDKFYIKRSFKHEYNSTSGAIASLMRGNFILISLSTGRHTQSSTLNCRFAFKYHDI